MSSRIDIPKVNIGEEIRKKFKDSRLTQREFAGRIGMSHQNIHRILDNESIDTNRLVAVSNALDFNFFELFCTKSDTKIHTEGNQSPATFSGRINMVYGESNLAERVRFLEEQIKDKDKIISLLERMIK